MNDSKTVDTKRSWSNLFPEFMSLKAKTNVDGTPRTKTQIDSGPDLLDCYEKARFERIGVRVRNRRDGYVKREKGREEKKAAERGTSTRPVYEPFEGTFRTGMDGGKRVLKWRDEERWGGYRQGPLGFSDNSILVQPTRALPEDSNPKSRLTRGEKEAKEAIRGSGNPETVHTLSGLDPGETYLSYGYSTTRGSSLSTCLSVKKGVNKERDEITKGVGERLREGATGAELVKARHGTFKPLCYAHSTTEESIDTELVSFRRSQVEKERQSQQLSEETLQRLNQSNQTDKILKLRHPLKEEEEHKVKFLIRSFLPTGVLSRLHSTAKSSESKLRLFRDSRTMIDGIEGRLTTLKQISL